MLYIFLCVPLFIYSFIHLFIFGHAARATYKNLSSLTRDWTQVPGSDSAKS